MDILLWFIYIKQVSRQILDCGFKVASHYDVERSIISFAEQRSPLSHKCCNKITSVRSGDGLTYFQAGAIFPASVNSLSDGAFSHCSSLVLFANFRSHHSSAKIKPFSLPSYISFIRYTFHIPTTLSSAFLCLLQ